MIVLVVEDAASVRQRLVAGFRRAGGVERVAEAGSGEEALGLVEEVKPDLVILDLMLPGMSGMEVLEAMQGSGTTAKVIVLTNYPYPAFRRRCLELGASHFFGKSTDIAQLVEAGRALMSAPGPAVPPEGSLR